MSFSDPPRTYNVWAYRESDLGADLVAQNLDLAEARMAAVSHQRQHLDQTVDLLRVGLTLEQHEYDFRVVWGVNEEGERWFEVESH